MANNKYNESIEDKAFKALDEALQIDFGEDDTRLVTARSPTPRRPNCPKHQVPAINSRQTEAKRARAANTPRPPEQPSRAPSFAANDATRMSPASLLKSLENGSSRSAIRNGNHRVASLDRRRPWR